jgi:ribosomal-protein-alanine N-acetyltransferase
MIKIYEIHKEDEFPQGLTREQFVEFLYTHLDQFGDTKRAINKCLDFAFEKNGGLGGFLLAAIEDGKLLGALIMNKTGMAEYIPENILVYVAVHKDTRGRGLGGDICRKAIDIADGDVKLHVEYENPAKRLYERLGFTTKYAEMRYTKKG